ncbi:hypothetical protein D918_09559 [Trichuris suis]|nr:hypothetical protein D918_09559 [Trichuris suis]
MERNVSTSETTSEAPVRENRNNELDKQIKEKNACIQSLTKRCDDLDHELSLLKESTETEKAW